VLQLATADMIWIYLPCKGECLFTELQLKTIQGRRFLCFSDMYAEHLSYLIPVDLIIIISAEKYK
jgi:hypothetical protein